MILLKTSERSHLDAV